MTFAQKTLLFLLWGALVEQLLDLGERSTWKRDPKNSWPVLLDHVLDPLQTGFRLQANRR